MPHIAAQWITVCLLGFGLAQTGFAQTQAQPKDFETQVRVHGLWWDLHEVNVAQVQRFANQTGFVSLAEKEGGGFIYEAGWTQKKGWNWKSPFGKAAHDHEPAVHLTFDEAQQICKFQGKRLPTDAEWVKAAYLEQRDNPPAGFVKGQRYPFPNGASAKQSHCLSGCGDYPGRAPQGALSRGWAMSWSKRHRQASMACTKWAAMPGSGLTQAPLQKKSREVPRGGMTPIAKKNRMWQPNRETLA